MQVNKFVIDQEKMKNYKLLKTELNINKNVKMLY